jgi:hypothetical protein
MRGEGDIKERGKINTNDSEDSPKKEKGKQEKDTEDKEKNTAGLKREKGKKEKGEDDIEKERNSPKNEKGKKQVSQEENAVKPEPKANVTPKVEEVCNASKIHYSPRRVKSHRSFQGAPLAKVLLLQMPNQPKMMQRVKTIPLLPQR